jgi:ribosomal subunit interface protein
MDIVVAARHGTLPEHVAELARGQFERLGRFESRVSRVEVTVANEKNRWEVDAHASVDRDPPVHAHGEARDARSAIDQAVDRMTRQVKRLRERHRDHQGPAREVEPPTEPTEGP